MKKEYSIWVLVSIVINVLLATFLIFTFLKEKPNSANKASQNDFESEFENFELTDPLASATMTLEDSASNNETLSQESQDEYATLKLLLHNDPNIELLKYRSEEFKNSALKEKLDIIPTMSLYLLVKFKAPIEYKTLEYMKSKGLITVNNKMVSESIGKKHEVFLGKYISLRNLLGSPHIENIYILTKYTAKGFYKLNFLPQVDKENATINFHLPFSKPGRTLLSRPVSVGGIQSVRVFSETLEDRVLTYELELKKNIPLQLYCDLKYIIDIEKLLQHHIRIAGTMTLQSYQERMARIPQFDTFLKPTQKIQFTKTISNLAKKVTPSTTISQAWSILSKELDQMIQYDWDKRTAFFGGQISYTNIRDMYLSTYDLLEKPVKVGACPERAMVEAAYFRMLGVPTRTTTRLYHMFVEVYIPETGWVTTSGILNEIPLIESSNQDQSYFVDWAPAFPVKLKWEGGLYPVIIF